MGNAPGHPLSLNDICEQDRLEFLAKNTLSLILLMIQGVIAIFKAYYLRGVFAQLEKLGKNRPTVRDIWRGYNIMNAIDNIASSWK